MHIHTTIHYTYIIYCPYIYIYTRIHTFTIRTQYIGMPREHSTKTSINDKIPTCIEEKKRHNPMTIRYPNSACIHNMFICPIVAFAAYSGTTLNRRRPISLLYTVRRLLILYYVLYKYLYCIIYRLIHDRVPDLRGIKYTRNCKYSVSIIEKKKKRSFF